MRTIGRAPLQIAVAVELARCGLTQGSLARRLKVPPTTLSTWLTAAHPAPPDLPDRIERALRLTPGTLPRPAAKRGSRE